MLGIYWDEQNFSNRIEGILVAFTDIVASIIIILSFGFLYCSWGRLVLNWHLDRQGKRESEREKLRKNTPECLKLSLWERFLKWWNRK